VSPAQRHAGEGVAILAALYALYQEANIVAVGIFNPAMFSVDMLKENGLLGAEDADLARDQGSYVLTRQVNTLETEWARLQVLENQLLIMSKGALSPAVRDIAVGILSLLSYTNISAVGLNFFGHYKMSSRADYHRVGDVFAPKTIWNDIFPTENHNTGMETLTVVVQPARREENAVMGNVKQITLQPSKLIPDGLFLSCNDHYVVEADDQTKIGTAERVARLIETKWEPSWQETNKLFNSLISKALGEESSC